MVPKIGARAFAERLRALREAKGWTQADLAKRLRRAPTTISHWENCVNEPRLEDLIAARRTFGQPIDWLLGLEGEDLTTLYDVAEGRRDDRRRLRAFEKVAQAIHVLTQPPGRKR